MEAIDRIAAADALVWFREALTGSSEDSIEGYRDLIEKTIDEWSKPGKRMHAGYMYHPIRIALSGKKQSSPPQEILYVIGKEEGLRRIDIALGKLTHRGYVTSWGKKVW